LFEDGQVNIEVRAFVKILSFFFSGIVHIKKDVSVTWKVQNYKNELMNIVKKGQQQQQQQQQQ
jgi:hypothetical protein